MSRNPDVAVRIDEKKFVEVACVEVERIVVSVLIDVEPVKVFASVRRVEEALVMSESTAMVPSLSGAPSA